MTPDVVYLVLCERAQIDPNNLHRINLFGLLTSIRSTASPSFPVKRTQIAAVTVWTGGQGSGELICRVIQDTSGRPIFHTRPRPVRFVGDPTAVGAVIFNIRNCSFPAAGLYWVEVLFAGAVIARQRLFLRD